MQQTQATTSQQIQQFLHKNGGTALISCYATWCGPSLAIAGYIKASCQKNSVPLIQVDVDKSMALIDAYRLNAVPTILAVHRKWNKVIDRTTGNHQPSIDKLILQCLEQFRYNMNEIAVHFLNNLIKNYPEEANTKTNEMQNQNEEKFQNCDDDLLMMVTEMLGEEDD